MRSVLIALALVTSSPDAGKQAQAVRLGALIKSELKKPESQRAMTPIMLFIGVNELVKLDREGKGLPPVPPPAPFMGPPPQPYLDKKGNIVAPWLALTPSAPPPAPAR